MSVDSRSDPDRATEIAARLSEVRARIDRACSTADRPPDNVTLVVVTKTFPASDVSILQHLGCADVAENKDQEARLKVAEFSHATPALCWHMIGQVQRNKARSVAAWADVIESVDRLSLAEALSAGAVTANRRLDILLQISLDPDDADGRGGVRAIELPDLAARVSALPGLTVRGIMGIAPYPGDPDVAFNILESASLQLRTVLPDADRISAGMSGDLEAAVRHGATHVRIGGAILGKRAIVG